MTSSTTATPTNEAPSKLQNEENWLYEGQLNQSELAKSPLCGTEINTSDFKI